MVASKNKDWEERDVERSEEGRHRWNEIGVGKDRKTVDWGSSRIAGPSRISWAFASRADSTTLEKWYFRRGLQKSNNYTTGMIPGVA